jgi:hypothetical protein
LHKKQESYIFCIKHEEGVPTGAPFFLYIISETLDEGRLSAGAVTCPYPPAEATRGSIYTVK